MMNREPKWLVRMCTALLLTALSGLGGSGQLWAQQEDEGPPRERPRQGIGERLLDELFDELQPARPDDPSREPPDPPRQRPPRDDDQLPPRQRPGDAGRQEGPSTRLVPPRDDLPPDRWRAWKLGVHTRNTRTGVIVTNVLRDSAAWDAGLEEGDTIISVNGYQVGYVNDRLYDLGDELQVRADRRGHVTLLVQNRRNNELVNVDVHLDRQLR